LSEFTIPTSSIIFRDTKRGKLHIGEIYPPTSREWEPRIESHYPEPIVKKVWHGIDPIWMHIPRDSGFIFLRINSRTKP
jgi:hypothetical protein